MAATTKAATGTRTTAQPAQQWTAAPGPAPANTARPFDERQYAMFLHLSALANLVGIPAFLGPLIMWLIKKDESAFVDRHGRAAMNFHISFAIYGVAAGLIIGVIAIVTLGIGVLLLIPVIILGAIAGFVLMVLFPILAGIKAGQGREHRYPLAITFLHPRQ